ncbi:MAG: hypothetical protein H7276_00635 [Caulobacter sp.]|nr:hypothetical protein [Vitreoscilla sp.]
MAGLGWWWVRGPAIQHGAAVSPPEIDIDPPSMRAQRDAALALAVMPDDPWTFAESLAASAPSKAALKEQCGIEDGPQFAKPAAEGDTPVQMRAPTARFIDAQARLDAALRASSDPLDRAVADLIDVGRMRDIAGRDEAVVQQAATTSDARLYAIGYGLCHSLRDAPPSCSSISARRWTQVDAGNGTPWIHLLAQAQASGDDAGMREAMENLAASSRFDLYYTAIPGAIARHVTDDTPELAAASDLVSKGEGEAADSAFPSYSALMDLCRNHAGGDEARERQCRTTSDTMAAHSDTLLSVAMSGALLLRTTGDSSRRDAFRAEQTVLKNWSPATGFSPCQDMRDSLKMHVRGAQVGEVEAMRERARKFVTP